ncbi:hypothetical protein HC928_02670 [bacterium]|nr:hypothetical protein [bacterium]
MDTDGGITGRCVGLTHKAKQVAEGVQLLLQSLGIQSRLKQEDKYYRVVVRQEYLELYSSVVLHQLEYKTEHAQRNAVTKYTKAPIPTELLAQVRTLVTQDPIVWKSLSRSRRAAVKSLRMNKYTALQLLKALPVSHETENLADLLNLNWVTIRSVTPVGIRPTMDLTINHADHSYICRGLVQHNTAADLFKIAVVRVSKLLEGTKSKLVNFVHDEIQVYLHKSETHLIPEIRKAMEDWHFTVPIVADFSLSKTSWAAKQKVEAVL